MTKRRSPRRETRVLRVDGDLYLVVGKNKDALVTRRLRGRNRALAQQMLDDCQFEIWAHLVDRK